MRETEPSEREQAARAWVEALTVLDRRTDYGALRERLRKHLTEEEICRLTSAVTTINLWNRVRACRHRCA